MRQILYSDIMVFGLFRKKKEAEEDVRLDEFHEIPMDMDDQTRTKVMIEKLDGVIDVDRIVRKARSGNIVIVGIKDVRERSMDELKHSISKMKTSVAMFNGDIAGVGEEWLILTPSSARIHRGE